MFETEEVIDRNQNYLDIKDLLNEKRRNLLKPLVGNEKIFKRNETFFETKDLPNELTIIPFGIKDQEG